GLAPEAATDRYARLGEPGEFCVEPLQKALFLQAGEPVHEGGVARCGKCPLRGVAPEEAGLDTTRLGLRAMRAPNGISSSIRAATRASRTMAAGSLP
ncbi:MAG: hypothetical protein CVV27_20190, partial [Candidatus Melainabacteria bacterium HGW-Melainabacteria-1]